METEPKELYVGVDPGLTAPCMCILGEGTEPLAVLFILGKQYDDLGTYGRPYGIACRMAYWINEKFPKSKIRLAIEGPSFGSKNSSSMEQMAQCRQAVYDAFYALCADRLLSTDRIAPTTAKKTLTGNGRATKEDMITFARVIAPKYMSRCETHRTIKKRNGTEEKVLDEKTAAVADSLGVAYACQRRWARR